MEGRKARGMKEGEKGNKKEEGNNDKTTSEIRKTTGGSDHSETPPPSSVPFPFLIPLSAGLLIGDFPNRES